MQTSPPKAIQPQNYLVATEQSPRNQTGIEPEPFISCSENSLTNIQDSEQYIATTRIGDTTNPPLTITTPLIEEELVRAEQTIEVYLPLSYTVVLKRKQEMLYVPLDFKKNQNLIVDALVESGACVSAIAQNHLNTMKQQTPNSIPKIDDPPNFQIEVANGQLEKPLATTTPKLEIGYTLFAEHFVVMKDLTGPSKGLHFMRNIRVVIDTTHGNILFPHLTMQVKTSSSERTAKPQPVNTNGALTVQPRTTKLSQTLLTICQNGTPEGLWHYWRNLRKQQVCWFTIQYWQKPTKQKQSG